MYAIASLFDPETDQKIRALWKRFEEHCGLTGIKRMDLPHFSWLVADAFQMAALEPTLQDLAATMPPLRVHSGGLGVFTGPLPVVYLSLVKNAALLAWHTALWKKTRPFAVVPNMLYHPDRWVPHITLAYHEIDPQQLGCAMQEIVYTSLDLSFTVDNLALIYHTNGKDGIHQQYPLLKKEQPMARIPESHHDLISDDLKSYAFLSTLMPDGTPQVTPVWFSVDGDDILINSAKGRVKDRNMRARPRVAVAIQDPRNPSRYVQVRGEVVEITEEGAREHINRLNFKYSGSPNYGGPADETRVIYRIRPLKVNTMG